MIRTMWNRLLIVTTLFTAYLTYDAYQYHLWWVQQGSEIPFDWMEYGTVFLIIAAVAWITSAGRKR